MRNGCRKPIHGGASYLLLFSCHALTFAYVFFINRHFSLLITCWSRVECSPIRQAE